MLRKMLFKSFNNNTCKTKRKKETRTNTKEKKIGNNISDIESVIIKWKNIKKNTEKRKKIKIKMLRTAFHVGDARHRPIRNITIER